MDIQLSYAHLSVPGSPLLGDFLKAFTLSKSYEVDRLLISMLTIKKKSNGDSSSHSQNFVLFL